MSKENNKHNLPKQPAQPQKKPTSEPLREQKNTKTPKPLVRERTERGGGRPPKE